MNEVFNRMTLFLLVIINVYFNHRCCWIYRSMFGKNLSRIKDVILLDKKNLNYKSKKILQINLLNKKKLSSLFDERKINTIIHLAEGLFIF